MKQCHLGLYASADLQVASSVITILFSSTQLLSPA